MNRRRRGGIVATCIVVALTTAACSSGPVADRAGGVPAPEPASLTTAMPAGEVELAAFGSAVSELSGGTLEVEVLGLEGTRTLTGLEPADILEALRDGDLQLAVLPVRDLAGLGVDSFDALVTPFAIDSLELQGAVLSDEGLVASMLSELDELGVHGVGLLPGPLQYGFGRSRDLVSVSAYDGARIAASPGEVAADSIHALGATPVPAAFNGEEIGDLDGAVLQLQAITGNAYHTLGGAITVDAPLWPRPFVVVANPGAFAALTPAQQDALRAATIEAIPGVLATERELGDEAISIICRSGLMRLVEAGPAAIEGLREATDAVRRPVRDDDIGGRVLDGVEQLSATIPPEPVPACPVTPESWPTEIADTLDGTYVAETTADDLRAQGVPERDVVHENWGRWVLVVDDGRFAFAQENDRACTWGYGDARMDDRLLHLVFADGGGIAPNGAVWRPGEFFLYRWTLFGDILRLDQALEDGPPDYTLTRVSSTPEPGRLPGRCPLPAGALDRD